MKATCRTFLCGATLSATKGVRRLRTRGAVDECYAFGIVGMDLL